MPLTAQLLPELEDIELLLSSPLVTAHARINHINPALTTLTWLTRAALANHLVEFLCNAGPLLWLIQITGHALRSNIFSNFLEDLRLTGCPSRFLTLDILNEEPALLALQ